LLCEQNEKLREQNKTLSEQHNSYDEKIKLLSAEIDKLKEAKEKGS
jgi:FtsZ-binding cell division protein ZapB